MGSDQQHEIYRNMLLSLSNFIDNDDLDKMKFRCDKIVNRKAREKIKSPLEFFIALEDRGHLGPSDTVLLRELLTACCGGKVDGLRVLDQYETGRIPASNQFCHQMNLQFQGVPQQNTGNQPQIINIYHNGTAETPTRMPATPYSGPDLKEEISLLCRSLGRDWKFYMRSLGIQDDDIESISQDYRSSRERIHQSLSLWQQEQQQSASKQKLIDACRHSSVLREDIATKLEDGSYR